MLPTYYASDVAVRGPIHLAIVTLPKSIYKDGSHGVQAIKLDRIPIHMRPLMLGSGAA
jgi:hypothetical protein